MNGSSIPYHLRAHKAVDRRLFLDLLVRLQRWRALEDYAYVSMGGYPLEDHRLINRLIGIERLLAFDLDAEVVNRQRFNRPIDKCKCVEKTSTEVAADLDTILQKEGMGDAEGVIVWLDYTSRAEIGDQLREFFALLSSLAPGDIVRVTVNAHLRDFFARDPKKILLAERQRPKDFDDLQGKIKEFMPSWATPEHMTEDSLPKVLAASFRDAASKAVPVSTGRIFILFAARLSVLLAHIAPSIATKSTVTIAIT